MAKQAAKSSDEGGLDFEVALDEMFASGDAGAGPATAVGKKAAGRDDADPNETLGIDSDESENVIVIESLDKLTEMGEALAITSASVTPKAAPASPSSTTRQTRHSTPAVQTSGSRGRSSASRRSTRPPLRARRLSSRRARSASARSSSTWALVTDEQIQAALAAEGDPQAARPDPHRRQSM